MFKKNKETIFIFDWKSDVEAMEEYSRNNNVKMVYMWRSDVVLGHIAFCEFKDKKEKKSYISYATDNKIPLEITKSLF